MIKRITSSWPGSLMRQASSVCFLSGTTGTCKVLNHIVDKRKHKRKALYQEVFQAFNHKLLGFISVTVYVILLSI